VLIVEDDEVNLKLARSVLQASGYEVLEAITGEQGVSLARQAQPDLVLMDIQLPGIDGIEAFRQLRADSATRAIPVIAVTASTSPADRVAIRAAGFDAFLAKPVKLTELVDTVRRVLDGARRRGG
jgi:two-component system cell cycle response regulator DivK